MTPNAILLVGGASGIHQPLQFVSRNRDNITNKESLKKDLDIIFENDDSMSEEHMEAWQNVLDKATLKYDIHEETIFGTLHISENNNDLWFIPDEEKHLLVDSIEFEAGVAGVDDLQHNTAVIENEITHEQQVEDDMLLSQRDVQNKKKHQVWQSVTKVSMILQKMNYKQIKIGSIVIIFMPNTTVGRVVAIDRKHSRCDVMPIYGSAPVIRTFDQCMGIYNISGNKRNVDMIDPKQWLYLMNNDVFYSNSAIEGRTSNREFEGWVNDKGVVRIVLPVRKAFAFFAGDSSVGIPDASFEMQVPDFTQNYTTSDFDVDGLKKEREYYRAKIADTYSDMEGEQTCRVMFNDEVYAQEMMDWEQMENFDKRRN